MVERGESASVRAASPEGCEDRATREASPRLHSYGLALSPQSSSPSSSVAATRCRLGSQGLLGLVAGTSVPARTGRRSDRAPAAVTARGLDLRGEPLAASIVIGHPPDPS